MRLQAAPCGFFSFDDDHRLVEINAEGARTLGYEPAELVGVSLSQLLPVTVRIFFSTYLLPLLAVEGRADEIYALLRHKDGSELPVLLNAARSPSAPNEYDCVFLVVKRRAAFERHREQAPEAAPPARVTGQEGAEFNDRLMTLGVLLASVMHEVRNPLTYSLQSLESLSEELDGTRAPDLAFSQELVGELRDGLGRIHALVDAVGMVSRTQADPTARIDCARVITTAAKLVTHRLGFGIEVKLELPPSGALVSGEEGRLAQVLINLLLNAGQAIGSQPSKQGRIVVRHRLEAGRAVIEVSDSGPGVPEQLRQRIFEPFVTTKPVGEGTGLGLPLSRQIVVSLGGTLELLADAGPGATFRLALPLASAEP